MIQKNMRAFAVLALFVSTSAYAACTPNCQFKVAIRGIRPAGPAVSLVPNGSGGALQYSDGTFAPSCQAYLQPANSDYQAGTSSGIYVIKVGGAVMPVYCNQTLNGGGWALLMKQANGDGTTLKGDTSYWTNGTTLNDTAANQNTNDGNVVSAAFSQMPTTQLMLQASDESTVQTYSNPSEMTAMVAFSGANTVAYSDAINTWNPSEPNWGLHTTTYPNGNALTGARFGFNFGEIWTSNHPGVVRCGARWGWAGNQDTSSGTGTSDQHGSFDACGGLGGYGAIYGGIYMNNSMNTWQTATYYLWGK
jgi:hypothetical protein